MSRLAVIAFFGLLTLTAPSAGNVDLVIRPQVQGCAMLRAEEIPSFREKLLSLARVEGMSVSNNNVPRARGKAFFLHISRLDAGMVVAEMATAKSPMCLEFASLNSGKFWTIVDHTVRVITENWPAFRFVRNDPYGNKSEPYRSVSK